MVSTSTSDRKQQLLDLAESYFARRAQMPVHAKDDALEKLITLDFNEGKPIVIVTMRADGITPAMIDWYQNDIYTHCTKIDKAVQMKQLEVHPDHKIVHQRIITPVMVSNRSIIQTFFEDK